MQTFTFSSDTTDSSKGKSLKMVFEGSLTLQNANQIKKLMAEHIAEYPYVALVAREVTAIDIAFLQLIESFKNHLEQAGKAVSIKMELPYDLKTLLSNAGISYPIK